MKVKDLIKALQDEDPEADVHYMRKIHSKYIECPPVSDAEEVQLEALTIDNGLIYALAPSGHSGKEIIVVLLS